MNISELARKLKVQPKLLRELLPQMGFDVGGKAIKIDNQTAEKVLRSWSSFYRRWQLEGKKEEDDNLIKTVATGELKEIYIPKIITVKAFAIKINTPVNVLMKILMKNGILASLNDNIDFESAMIIADDLGWKVLPQEEDISLDSLADETIKEAVDASKNLSSRAPVVVVMGHVDHGKTKILDTIRSTNVIEGEAGGITQHIGAYNVEKNGRNITFIDTPGHEAFTAMRSRGAKVADIAIVVVAVDDGVQPQTREVIDIVTAAKIPFVVAINKMDKEEANPEKVKRELSELNVISEDWGGKVIMVPVSAKSGKGIDELLETILLVADMEKDKIIADSGSNAIGSVIESHINKGEGVVATLLIQNGTLRVNDYLKISNVLYGRVRAMKNWKGEDIKSAGPSVPVKILGLKIAPEVGDILSAIHDTKGLERDVKKASSARTMNLFKEGGSSENTEDKEILNIILKTDVLGSAEAIMGSLQQFRHPKLAIKVIHHGLGNITNNDIDRALSAGAVVYGFHVQLDVKIEYVAREQNVKVKMFEIIYDLLDDVRRELENIFKPEIVKNEIGKLMVKAIFKGTKDSQIVGGKIIEGNATNTAKFDIIRNNVKIDVGRITELQSGKQTVNQVVAPNECGMKVVCREDILVDDVLHIYNEENLDQKIEL